MEYNHIQNLDADTVTGFGEEWVKFDQSNLDRVERDKIAMAYFSALPVACLHPAASVMDVGCGSGRWAQFVAPKVDTLTLVDASPAALNVARRNLANVNNVEFFERSVAELPGEDESYDVIYSLGVLHHIPDTGAGISACVAKLKPGGYFLVYLYYSLDNRSAWFRSIWRASDVLRRSISKLPGAPKKVVAEVIAASVYWPLSRIAMLIEKAGRNASSFPLSAYRDKSFYTMRTDALDRFGTRLEHRYSQAQIREMLTTHGLVDVTFRTEEPFWCASGKKQRNEQ